MFSVDPQHQAIYNQINVSNIQQRLGTGKLVAASTGGQRAASLLTGQKGGFLANQIV